MIEIDEEVSKTIPSVVSLVPTSTSLDVNENDSEQHEHQQQLLLSSQLPHHQIHIGNNAIQNAPLYYDRITTAV